MAGNERIKIGLAVGFTLLFGYSNFGEISKRSNILMANKIAGITRPARINVLTY